jgi:hypothetical protein
MTDPIVLLIPVILFVIASLLVFVGCGLQSHGIGDPLQPPFDTAVTLHIQGYHIGAGVKTIDVVFAANIDDLPNRSTAHHLTHDDIAPDISVDFPETVINDFNLVRLIETGSVTCQCTVTYENEDQQQEAAVHAKLEDEPVAVFELTRDVDTGDFFFLGE